MIDIKNQAFGLELEFSGITRRKAAEAVAMVINGSSYFANFGGVYDKHVVTAADGRKWIVERDASVHALNGGEPCEFVTPICSYEDIPLVQECIRALRRAGAKVDSSCGIHIHIDGKNHNAKSLKNLVFNFRAKERLIFNAIEAPERRSNYYCKTIGDDLIENIKKIKKLDDNNLRKVWYNTYAPYGDPAAHYNDSRYHAINLHSLWYRGTVEFRLFASTLHAGKVRAYIVFCLALSAYAINSKRASASVLDNGGNDKYEFRCLLLRLGLIGDEFKNCREHLLKNLEGNAAWRNDPHSYESYNNRNRSA